MDKGLPIGFAVAMLGLLVVISAYPVTLYYNTPDQPLAGFAIGEPILIIGAVIAAVGVLITLLFAILLLIQE